MITGRGRPGGLWPGLTYQAAGVGPEPRRAASGQPPGRACRKAAGPGGRNCRHRNTVPGRRAGKPSATEPE